MVPETLRLWNDWKSLAGTRQVAGFYTRHGVQVRVRTPDQAPAEPDDSIATTTALVTVRSDTNYAPVRALLR